MLCCRRQSVEGAFGSFAVSTLCVEGAFGSFAVSTLCVEGYGFAVYPVESSLLGSFSVKYIP
jgi:hypothetical protein